MIRSALITGASSGIGEALSKRLAREGISLFLSGRNWERLEAVGKAVGAKEVILADLQQRGETRGRGALVALLRTAAPDLLVNNAGFGLYGDAVELSLEKQLEMVEVNNTALLELTLEAARSFMAAQKHGVIMNVSSVSGEYPCPGMSVYGATKAFVTSLSQALYSELAPKGILVLVSCPGMIATDFAKRAAEKEVTLEGGPILTAEFAAEQIWQQILARQQKRIFDWRYRLGSRCAKYLLPLSLVKQAVWKRINKRIHKNHDI